jgi:uncharacterized protein DUF1629
MAVYLLRPDSSRYEVLVLECEDDAGLMLEASGGRPVGSAWSPVAVRVFREDADHRDRPSSDFPSLSGFVPVFSQKAVTVLADLLQPNGEILPLACGDGEYSAYNVITVIDALDEERSQCKYIGKKVVDVASYELLPDRLGAEQIFKLVQFRRGGRVYVTEQFVRRVDEQGLLGFAFQKVWPHDP